MKNFMSSDTQNLDSVNRAMLHFVKDVMIYMGRKHYTYMEFRLVTFSYFCVYSVLVVPV